MNKQAYGPDAALKCPSGKWGAVGWRTWGSSPGKGWPEGLTFMEKAPHEPPSSWQAGSMTPSGGRSDHS